jgi:hypothetical protein
VDPEVAAALELEESVEPAGAGEVGIVFCASGCWFSVRGVCLAVPLPVSPVEPKGGAVVSTALPSLLESGDSAGISEVPGKQPTRKRPRTAISIRVFQPIFTFQFKVIEIGFAWEIVP